MGLFCSTYASAEARLKIRNAGEILICVCAYAQKMDKVLIVVHKLVDRHMRSISEHAMEKILVVNGKARVLCRCLSTA